MSYKYDYTISADFTLASRVDIGDLQELISNDTAITAVINYIDTMGDSISIYFASILSTAEETDLTTIVSNYTYKTPVDVPSDSSFQYTRTVITNTNSPYSILTSDEIIGINTATGVVSVTLPLISNLTTLNNFIKYYIVDEGGNSSINNITVNTSGSDTINKKIIPMVISVDHTSITLYSDGTSNWVIL